MLGIIGVRMLQPEDITDRYRELCSPPILAPRIGDGLAGRVSKQFPGHDGHTIQIKCELCPNPEHEFCSMACSDARRQFDAKDPVKVT